MFCRKINIKSLWIRPDNMSGQTGDAHELSSNIVNPQIVQVSDLDIPTFNELCLFLA